MADSQLKNLSSRTLALTDVIPTQGTTGDAGKNTIQEVADLIKGGKKTVVLKLSKSGSTITGVVLESEFGSTTFSYTNPSNGNIVITPSATAFTDDKTVVRTYTYNNAGTPYEVAGAQSGNEAYVSFYAPDGTQNSTPNFQNVIVEIVVYP